MCFSKAKICMLFRVYILNVGISTKCDVPDVVNI